MQELKIKDLCMKCKFLDCSHTSGGYPVYCCRKEYDEQEHSVRMKYGRWHKLSTILYTEPPKDCPYYTEHVVMKLNEDTEEEKVSALRELLGFKHG